MKKFLTILFSLISTIAFSQNFDFYNGKKIEKGKVIVKYASTNLKSSSRSIVSDSRYLIDSYLKSINATPLVQKFSIEQKNTNCEKCVDISQIYEFTYSDDVPIGKVLAYLNNLDCVEYAEPSYVGELFLTPNDSEYSNGNLWHLNTCKVLDAWDIEEGDESVIIAIVDGGIDILQTDLINQIAYNLNDPINGVDDDGDGYIDNYRGWDVADNDYNPTSSSVTEHGTYVAGIAGAEVNNEFGTAGVGYKTKILPIKICKDGSADVTAGYDGIVYAANQGCKVINCSWGDAGDSQYGADIVKYATYNCDALVVAAAGNSASTEEYFPASYSEVLSVGGTVVGDYVWADSEQKGTHYNRFVDICAPAKGFYSIANNDQVIAMAGGGTSFSSPIVAGAAALVKSHYPNYSAIQIGELLRVTADDIYELNSEEKYQDKLGGGRVNVYKALTDDVLPSIRIVNYDFDYNTKQPLPQTGDVLDLYVTVKNYLHEAQNLTISAACEMNILEPIVDSITIEKIASGEELQCHFSFKILSVLPYDLTTYFKFKYAADNNYLAFEYQPIRFNQKYYDFEIGNIRSTATADGSIAVYYSTEDQNGFQYKNSGNCIYQAGLVLAESQNEIHSRSSWKSDFNTLKPMTIIDSDTCDLVIYSKYEVQDLEINQNIKAWTDTDAILYEYNVANMRDSSLYNVHFGTFIDWDILTSAYNKIWYVDSLQLTVAASVDPRTVYVGTMMLNDYVSDLYAFNVDSDVIYYGDGFNNNELWYAFNNSQKSAGTNSVLGAEVAVFNYSIIDSIPSQDTVVIRYAMLAAESNDDLYELAYQLKQKYNPTKNTDTTEVCIQELTNDDIRLCKQNDSYCVKYEKSQKDVVFQHFSIQGGVIKTVVIPSEKQSGIYWLENFGEKISLLVVQREGETKTFKLMQ